MDAHRERVRLNYAQIWINQNPVNYIMNTLLERAQLIYAQTGKNHFRDIVLSSLAEFMSILSYPVI